MNQILETCYCFSCKSNFSSDHLLHSVFNATQRTNFGTAEGKEEEKDKKTGGKADKDLFKLPFLLGRGKI